MSATAPARLGVWFAWGAAGWMAMSPGCDSGSPDGDGPPDSPTDTPLSLTLASPDPGEPDRTNDVGISGADPGATITVWTGTSLGSSPAGECTVGIAEATELASVVADAEGSATFTMDVPAAASGSTEHLQAVAVDGCVTSPVLAHTWTVREWVGTWNPEVADIVFSGGEPGAVFGSRLSVTGDGDNSGLPDLAVGAPHHGDDGHGSVFAWYDPQPGDHASGVDHDLELMGEVDSWAGWGLQWVGDVDLDGDSDLMVGAPWDSTNGSQAGVAYLVLMPRTGDLELLASADAALFGVDAGGHAGGRISPADDADGDGRPDLWIGAFEENSSSGVLYLVSGTVRGSTNLPDVALAAIGGEMPGDRVGTTVVPAGDLDGDGTPDLVVGASGSDRNGADAGAAFVFTEPVAGIVQLADSDAVILGDVAGDLAGSFVALLGDLDGDGLVDLGIHAEGDSEGAPFSGAVSIASPPTSGDVALNDITTLKVLGEGENDAAGSHLATCDVDGDTYTDFVASAPEVAAEGGLYNAGAVYLFYGPLPTGVVTMSTADATFIGAEDRSKVGQDVGCVDLDADGLDDMVVGAEAEDTDYGNTTGALYVLEGRARLIMR